MVILRNCLIINENKRYYSDLLIKGTRIEKIEQTIRSKAKHTEIDLNGKYLIPGIIDDQVHFREPGLTHKGTIYSESRAAVAGGITSFMEMPNTVPNTLTQNLLEQKYFLASKNSVANYSFYMGASNENIEEVLKTDKKNVCGVKVFMGSSTGNMLVDNVNTLDKIFSSVDHLIATHCEDEATIKKNTVLFSEKYRNNIHPSFHPQIRTEEACYLSSSTAVSLAKKHNTRLHVLHISTAKETKLFNNHVSLEKKRITSEACVHHLFFNDSDYHTKGNFIKWNPSVKTEEDRLAIINALKNGIIDVIATDHAPHTLNEKQNPYLNCPSGGPLVQHALLAMLELSIKKELTIEMIIDKMTHNPAKLFKVENRGFIREGYYADLVVVDPNQQHFVDNNSILYKCGWSPFSGYNFKHKIDQTFVNGNLVWDGHSICSESQGKRLTFYNE